MSRWIMSGRTILRSSRSCIVDITRFLKKPFDWLENRLNFNAWNNGFCKYFDLCWDFWLFDELKYSKLNTFIFITYRMVGKQLHNTVSESQWAPLWGTTIRGRPRFFQLLIWMTHELKLIYQLGTSRFSIVWSNLQRDHQIDRLLVVLSTEHWGHVKMYVPPIEVLWLRHRTSVDNNSRQQELIQNLLI